MKRDWLWTIEGFSGFGTTYCYTLSKSAIRKLKRCRSETEQRKVFRRIERRGLASGTSPMVYRYEHWATRLKRDPRGHLKDERTL